MDLLKNERKIVICENKEKQKNRQSVKQAYVNEPLNKFMNIMHGPQAF